MPRSSESVAALATALAKAQAELVNPEKSLTATIKGERAGQERTFRYAPLSSGCANKITVIKRQKFSDTLTACSYFQRIIKGLREFFAGVR